MRTLSPLGKKKKGLSNMVAYVLLISITIALSALVYNWLRFYVGESDIIECPDGVNLIIQNYSCSSGSDGSLNVTLKNKGLFNSDGFIIRVNDRAGADSGFYTLEDSWINISVGSFYYNNYYFNDNKYSSFDLETITLIEVQPRMGTKKNPISCPAFTAQEIVC